MGRIRAYLFGVCLIELSANVARAAEGHSANLYANPLGLLAASFDGGLDFRVGQNWTLGPTFDIYNASSGDIKAKATGFGGRLNYYPHDAIATGLRVSLVVNSLPITVTTKAGSGRITVLSCDGLIGYQWVGGHWNFGIGGGLGFASGGTNANVNGTSVVTPGVSTTGFVWEIPVGFAF